MELHLDLIDSPQQLIKLCRNLEKQSFLGFDTEFIRERTYYPQLALIQLATEQDAWLIDVTAFTQDEIQPLLEILQSPNILKLLHSAFGDQECLLMTYGITAKPTLDTFETASLLGFGESVSLRDLIFRVFSVKIPKYLTRTNWLKRPLDPEMLRYAIADVEYLVSLGKKLIKSLEEIGRKEWALELSRRFEQEDLYTPDPAEMAQRIAKSGRINARNFFVFQELMVWRENRAKRLNLPRRRISDKDTLISIANARPKTIDQLAKFRGINLGEVRKQGDKIMNILHRDRNHENGLPLTPPRMVRPTSAQARIIDFLSTYLKTLCQENLIASRLVLTVKELQKIVVENLMDPKEWVRLKLCSPQAAQLVGQDLVAVLNGKKGLGIQNGTLIQLDL